MRCINCCCCHSPCPTISCGNNAFFTLVISMFTFGKRFTSRQHYHNDKDEISKEALSLAEIQTLQSNKWYHFEFYFISPLDFAATMKVCEVTEALGMSTAGTDFRGHMIFHIKLVRVLKHGRFSIYYWPRKIGKSERFSIKISVGLPKKNYKKLDSSNRYSVII